MKVIIIVAIVVVVGTVVVVVKSGGPDVDFSKFADADFHFPYLRIRTLMRIF